MNEEEFLKTIDDAVGNVVTELEDCKKQIDELTAENRQLKYDNTANRPTIARQKANNDKLKDKHMEELYEMYDLDRKEIDVLKSKNIELKNSLAASRATYRSAVVTIDEQKTFINRLLYSNKEFNAVLDNVRKELSGAKKHIADKDMLIECLESKIILKDKALVAAREIIDNSHRLAEHGREEIKSLEGELSACKQDLKVLKKVVEIVDMWDTYPVGKEMHKIYALVEDYLDVPDKENTDEPNE